MSQLPNGSWQSVAVDFHDPLPTGNYLLVIIDECARFV